MPGPLTEVQEAVLLERRLSQIEHGQDSMRVAQDDGFRQVLEAIADTKASLNALADRVTELEDWRRREKSRDDYDKGQEDAKNKFRKRDLAIIGGALAGIQGVIAVVVKFFSG